MHLQENVFPVDIVKFTEEISGGKLYFCVVGFIVTSFLYYILYHLVNAAHIRVTATVKICRKAILSCLIISS